MEETFVAQIEDWENLRTIIVKPREVLLEVIPVGCKKCLFKKRVEQIEKNVKNTRYDWEWCFPKTGGVWFVLKYNNDESPISLLEEATGFLITPEGNLEND